MEINQITEMILSAIEVRKRVEPGLFESFLPYELKK